MTPSIVISITNIPDNIPVIIGKTDEKNVFHAGDSVIILKLII
ncbi:hypothetical protein SMGD1_2527 [Sulfurimonas gotlandica GD1]|uniref:Uncharacterized protein n=1 Tax=Sulfurimonas gotlandica (strain DSM 19862 / JCM 16533 / GD1) TaxID=929558 RepID=H1FZP2_SULGG|nr:hypothetical protein SMGD1_2527 [Sulfurimonas gotlandica GD1]